MPVESPPAHAPALLSIAQLAALLGLSRRGVERLRASGRLGPTAISFGPRCVRFNAAEVQRWIAAGCPPRDRWAAMREGGGR